MGIFKKFKRKTTLTNTKMVEASSGASIADVFASYCGG